MPLTQPTESRWGCKKLLRLAVTGLVLVCSVHLVSLLAERKLPRSRIDHVETTLCGVWPLVDIEVINHAVEINERLPRIDGRVMLSHVGFLAVVSKGVHVPIWRNGRSSFGLLKLFLNRLVIFLWQCIHYSARHGKSNTSMHIDNGRLAAIVQVEANLEGYVDILRIVTLDIEQSDSKPRPMIVPKGRLSIYECLTGGLGSLGRSISGFLVGAVHETREYRVDNQNEKAKRFQSKRRLVYPISLFIAGYLVLVVG